MTILFASPNFNYACGVSRHIYNLIVELTQFHNYTIILFTNGGDAFERLDNIENLRIEKYYYSTTIMNILNLPRNLFILKKIIQKYQVDVVHSHHRYPEFLFMLLPNRIKKVNTAHSFVNGLRLFSFLCKNQIAVSNSIKRMIVNKYYKSSEEIKVLYNFIEEDFGCSDEEKIKNRKELSIPLHANVLFFAGRISYIKGIDQLVDIVLEIEKTHFIKLLLVGSVEDDLKNHIEKISSKAIVLIPPQKCMQKYISACDAVILPSRVDPFPYLMLEAGISKKFFLGSNVDGIAEFINNGVDGILFENGNRTQLKEALINWLELKYDVVTISNNLYKKVLTKCSKSDYINQLLLVYESNKKLKEYGKNSINPQSNHL